MVIFIILRRLTRDYLFQTFPVYFNNLNNGKDQVGKGVFFGFKLSG